jgi:hypothetical protein
VLNFAEEEKVVVAEGVVGQGVREIVLSGKRSTGAVKEG